MKRNPRGRKNRTERQSNGFPDDRGLLLRAVDRQITRGKLARDVFEPGEGGSGTLCAAFSLDLERLFVRSYHTFPVAQYPPTRAIVSFTFDTFKNSKLIDFFATYLGFAMSISTLRSTEMHCIITLCNEEK